MTPNPQANTLDEILNWRAKAVNEWRTNQAGIDPDFKYEFSDELFSRHREEAKQQIQALIDESKGCVDCKTPRCENCERLWQT